ncbi:MAG: efflux RND transporter periplasmic adaptor subunit, partial [Acidobacteria bacterium]|nr:efflux RND transporter periplasmic adaptor subunit [Acidobacteriota bacterium]
MKRLSVSLLALGSVALLAQPAPSAPKPAGPALLKLPGELLPFESVDMVARVNSFVEVVLVDRGSAVKQGAVLIKLSAPELQAQRAEAQAKVESIRAQRAEAEARLVAAQSTLERLKEAAATPGAIAAHEVVLAGKAVDAVAAQIAAINKAVAAAEAQVATIAELERFLTITAPFDGVVVERKAHPGALAGPAAGWLLRLEQLSRLRLVVAVPESQAALIPQGAKIAFTVAAFPGETFTGSVARVARVMDVKTRTMPVELDVANGRGRLAPGM